MYGEYKRPFDREDIFKDKVKILVKLDTFKDITDEEKDMIERLILLERLGCFRVLFVLGDNQELNQIVRENDGEVVSYSNEETYRPFVVMKTNKSDKGQDLLYGTFEEFQNIKQCKGKSNISVLEYCLISRLGIDYVVTCEKDVYFTDEINTKNIELNKLIDEIRILLVNRGIYKKYTNSTVNQGLYYYHRITSVFTYYSILREYTNELDNVKYQEVKDKTYSLAQRLKLLCKSSDKISYYYLKKQNNDTRDECLYHFGYFIMLVTGIFDDFTWIIKTLYNLKIKNNMDIKLRCSYSDKNNEFTTKNNEFTTCKFINKLSSINKELSDVLKDKSLQNDINILYPIRDTLQHREFIMTMGSSKVVGNTSIQQDSIIVIPKESAEFIKSSNFGTAEEWGIIFNIGDRYGINPCLFMDKVLNLINIISKALVDHIKWSEFLNTDELNKIEEDVSKLKNGELSTWTFSNDTLYFGRINLIEGND